MGIRQRTATAVIRTGRRWLHGTAVGGLPVTGAVVRRLVRFGHGSGDVTTGFRGLELVVPAGSATIAAGLFGGFYERIELDLFERLCANSALVVDVGANLGIYSCLAARQLPADGLLVAFEPVPENVSRLEANLVRNRVRPSVEVMIEPVAVGDTPGTVTLRLADDIGRHSVAGDGDGVLTVPVVALDSHLPSLLTRRPGRSRVDVLKIDVEGYDGHVLRGARSTIAADRPALLIEFCVSQLADCGFSAEEFVDLMAESYEEIYIIEEARSRVVHGTARDLLSPRYRSRLVNVVASARPDHQQLFADWARLHDGLGEQALTNR